MDNEMPLKYVKKRTSTRSDAQIRREVEKKIDSLLNDEANDAPAFIDMLLKKVMEFERRYEMSSKEMMEGLKAGTITETGDIAKWAWTWQTLQRNRQGTTNTTGTR
jgi:TATA-binding protein-associated factor Taf7